MHKKNRLFFSLNKKSIYISFFVLFLLTLSFFGLYQRLIREYDNRDNYIFAVDYYEVQYFSRKNQIPLDQILGKISEIGINALIIPEISVVHLVKEGLIDCHIQAFGQGIISLAMDKEGSTGAFFEEENQEKYEENAFLKEENRAKNLIYQGINLRNMVQDEIKAGFFDEEGWKIRLNPLSDHKKARIDWPLGFEEKGLLSAKRHKLLPVCEISEPQALFHEAIADYIENIKKWAGAIYFSGQEYWKNHEKIDAIVKEVGALPIFKVEFAREDSLDKALVKYKKPSLFIHSISRPELSFYSPYPEMAIARYKRAAVERSCKMILFRFDQSLKPDQQVGIIRNAIAAMNKWPWPIIPASFSSLEKEGSWPFSTENKLYFPVGSLGGIFDSPLYIRLALFFSFIIASFFPFLGLFLGQKYFNKHGIIVGILEIILFWVMGGLLISGFMGGHRFAERVVLFKGVKLSLILGPFLIILWNTRNNWDLHLKMIKEICSRPVFLFFLIFLVSGSLGLYIIRSGNYFREMIPQWELSLRDQLESILLVRPRTKEWFLGLPALYLFILSLRAKNGYGIIIFAPLAGTGGSSIINTFCHAHTPVLISFIRVLNGWLLGSLFFATVWLGYIMQKRLWHNGDD